MSAPIAQALLSVSDKTGIVEFARALDRMGVRLLSTGGTAKTLADAGLPVTEIGDYTGFPEMLDGRVKTLHPKVHAGILARRDVAAHAAALEQHAIAPIDLVVVNLYPFRETVAKPGCTLDEAIENIDIGGPTMVRAAAKNWAHVGVVVDAGDYASLAADGSAVEFPDRFNLQAVKVQDLRYGENPHQHAAFYREAELPAGALAQYRQLQGKELSYNNIADSDAAWECAKAFADEDASACVIVKHANPCGVALAATPVEAYRRAFATDPVSAFGGIIAFNRPVDGETVEAVAE